MGSKKLAKSTGVPAAGGVYGYFCVTQPAPLTVQNGVAKPGLPKTGKRSEEHTSELQSRLHLVCRLLLEKKKNKEKSRQLTVNLSLTSATSTITAYLDEYVYDG